MTATDAKTFMDAAENRLLELNVDSGRADWVKSTFITGDTEEIAAKLDQRSIDAQVEYAKQSTKYDGQQLDPALQRKMKILKTGLTIATPADPKESSELTRITSSMEGTYGKGKVVSQRPAKLQGHRRPD